MPTTPGGRFSPGDSDDWDLVTDLAAMQVSNESATSAEIAAIPSTYRVGTNAQRLAIPVAQRFEGLKFYASDTRIEWLYSGTGWTQLSPVSLINTSLNQGGIAGTATTLPGLSGSLVVGATGIYSIAVGLSTQSTSADDVISVRVTGLSGGNIEFSTRANSTLQISGSTQSHMTIRSLPAGTYSFTVQVVRVVGSGTVTAVGTTAAPAYITMERQ